MAIAEHHPDKLHAKNRGVLKMSHQQLHDFAATKGLSKHGKRPHGSGPFSDAEIAAGHRVVAHVDHHGDEPEPYRPGLPGQPVRADKTQTKDRGYNWSDPTWKNPYQQVGSNEA